MCRPRITGRVELPSSSNPVEGTWALNTASLPDEMKGDFRAFALVPFRG
jgi:hypothetical protein